MTSRLRDGRGGQCPPARCGAGGISGEVLLPSVAASRLDAGRESGRRGRRGAKISGRVIRRCCVGGGVGVGVGGGGVGGSRSFGEAS